MRFFRQMIDDVLSGGVLAALVAVMLLLQGAASGYAQAAAVHDLGPDIICSSHGDDNPQPAPFQDHGKRDCCLAACQLTHASFLALPALSSVFPPRAGALQAAILPRPGHRPALRTPGLPGSPRAPPVSPV